MRSIAKHANKINILLKEDRTLFHTGDLELLWNMDNKNTLYSTLNRYVKRGILVPIYRGFYSVKPLDSIDPIELGSAAIHWYSYLSTEYILAREGIIFQSVPYYTFCSSTTQNIQIGKYSYKVRQLKDEYLYKTTGIIDKIRYKEATVERAVADMLYFNPRYYFDARKNINWEKVQEVQKEVGYL